MGNTYGHGTIMLRCRNGSMKPVGYIMCFNFHIVSVWLVKNIKTKHEPFPGRDCYIKYEH